MCDDAGYCLDHLVDSIIPILQVIVFPQMDHTGHISHGQIVEGVDEVDQQAAHSVGDLDHVCHEENEQRRNDRDQPFRKRNQGLCGLVLAFQVFQEDPVVDQRIEDDSDRCDSCE